jgi:hypothetical protein
VIGHDKPIANPVAILTEGAVRRLAVLFNPDTADAVGNNPVGVVLWKLMDGENSLAQTVAALESGFCRRARYRSRRCHPGFVLELAERDFGLPAGRLESVSSPSDLEPRPAAARIMRAPRHLGLEIA